MVSHDDAGVPKEELLSLRREGGLWLKELRTKAGLSQREFADRLGADYYSFISQLEGGKGQPPIGKLEVFANALGVPHYDFAINFLRYYNPALFRMLGGALPDEPTRLPQQPLLAETRGTRQVRFHANRAQQEIDSIKARLSRLEALLTSAASR